MKAPYSLKKSRRILLDAYKVLKRNSFTEPEHREYLRDLLIKLEACILDQDQTGAYEIAVHVQSFIKQAPQRSIAFLYSLFDFVKAVTLAVVFALLIRQFWFELYEVPTGSMRPTILEQDRMIVSKTTFGLHLPFSNKVLGYSPQAINRGELVVFSIDGLPVADPDTKYFGIFPGKKRYVKRCIGKPGDMLYFYGGQIYGIDQAGKSFTYQGHSRNLNYIPFITFNGNTSFQTQNSQITAIFHQFALPCGRLIQTFSPTFLAQGQFFHANSWEQDVPALLKLPHEKPVSYADLFGMRNFATVQILSKKQLTFAHGYTDLSSPFYLEINHTPNLTYPPVNFDTFGKNMTAAFIQPMKAILPLRKEHIHLIKNNLTTSRFIVSRGKAFRYSPEPLSEIEKKASLSLPQVPDGCYEYIKGAGYKISWGGIRTKLKSSHPLMQLETPQVIELFNHGVTFRTSYAQNHFGITNRYAFYNQGNLYVMDALIFLNSDPELQRFIANEQTKEAESSYQTPYVAFLDRGAPSEDPHEYRSLIHNFSLKVPEGHILVLGDNYANSADSRDFGFVPVENLLGSPIGIFWPLNNFKLFNNLSLSWPSFLINGLALFIIIACVLHALYAKHKPLFPCNTKSKE